MAMAVSDGSMILTLIKGIIDNCYLFIHSLTRYNVIETHEQTKKYYLNI